MSDPLPEDAAPAQRWFALALEDLAGARVLLADGSVALRIIGFLSQQAAEKALKAGLFAVSIPAPKIHGLQQLLGCYPEGNTPKVDLDDLDLLDPWVIDGRYAADLPDVTVLEPSGCWRPQPEWWTRCLPGCRTSARRRERAVGRSWITGCKARVTGQRCWPVRSRLHR
jgi:HEPN domain-containing protein